MSQHLYDECQEPRLNFIANSDVIKELIQPLVIRCSAQTFYSERNRSVTVTFMNIIHETIGSLATVSKIQQYDASPDVSLNKVQGYLSNQGSRESYLQITWTHPTPLQTGKYTCVAHTINYVGIVEKLEAALSIEVKKTSFDDLVDVVIDVLENVEDEKTKVKMLQQKVDKGQSCSNVRSIKARVFVILASGLEVMCDTKTDGGGWIIFQRRINGKVDFYRGWKEYRDGFGDYNIGEFYLGNENIFKLTSTGQYDLRIDLEINKKKYFAEYKDFKVLSETDNYKLQIGNFTGNVSDDLSRQNNMFFSTFDRDNDRSTGNCAVESSGAWWYDWCSYTNLNGQWGSKPYFMSVFWHGVTRDSKSVSFTEMKIRERE
ncbi:fibrinogen-like protein A isoform X2 [Biomphalaria glabrata]|uniref:Fibrinogen-like protein A isoform X2 n=1 Tax=Biomphalaria glabrata TaxID=6526 RepID=A0A9W2YNR4_BIOGL|nr:fibrinogen-like protein A isoform X2 [Biomphalaria glabrata]